MGAKYQRNKIDDAQRACITQGAEGSVNGGCHSLDKERRQGSAISALSKTLTWSHVLEHMLALDKSSIMNVQGLCLIIVPSFLYLGIMIFKGCFLSSLNRWCWKFWTTRFYKTGTLSMLQLLGMLSISLLNASDDFGSILCRSILVRHLLLLRFGGNAIMIFSAMVVGSFSRSWSLCIRSTVCAVSVP